MSSSGPHPPLEEPESSRPLLYLSVVLVEALVILALWVFSRYFGR